jgi:predicted tellurium resistance membrane protein TerC
MDINRPQFLVAVLQIVWIDRPLSDDNAIVIALACRGLPEDRRRTGILLGAANGVGLRILFALMFWGGAALLGWIAGQMIVSDPLVAGRLATVPHLPAITGGAVALLVLGIAFRLTQRRPALREEPRG